MLLSVGAPLHVGTADQTKSRKTGELFFRTNSDVAIVCNTGGKSLERLLDFPVAPDSAPARAPEDNGNELEMRYNVFTREFEPIEEITDDQA